eukprot:454915-Rhodomonas_salina.2
MITQLSSPLEVLACFQVEKLRNGATSGLETHGPLKLEDPMSDSSITAKKCNPGLSGLSFSPCPLLFSPGKCDSLFLLLSPDLPLAPLCCQREQAQRFRCRGVDPGEEREEG